MESTSAPRVVISNFSAVVVAFMSVAKPWHGVLLLLASARLSLRHDSQGGDAGAFVYEG